MKAGNKLGFTLIEVIVSLGVLMIVFSGAVDLLYQSMKDQGQVEKQLDFVSARNRIQNRVIDENSWAVTVASASNDHFQCWKNQNQVPVTDRNCFNETQNLNLYNADGTMAYEGQSATSGVKEDGTLCTTYQSPPAAADPNCMMHINLNWKAICAGDPCYNPPILITAIPQLRTLGSLPSNDVKMEFTYLRTQVHCPTQVASTGFELVDLGATFTTDQITSQASGLSPNTGVVRNDVNLMPCQMVKIDFEDRIVNNPASLPSPLTLADANNNSKVCIATVTGTCLFSWVRNGLTYRLQYNGVDVASQPSTVTLSSTTEYEFQVINGLVRFCVDGSCNYFFDQKLDSPFRVYFTPANSSYSSGFDHVSISTSPNLSYTQ